MGVSPWNHGSGGIIDQFSKLDKYFQEHFDKLDQLIETVQSAEQVDEYKRLSASVNLDGTGSGNVTLTSGQGYGQKLERISFVVVGGATVGLTTVHSNSVAPGTVLETAAGSAGTITGIGQVVVYADAFSNNIYVSDQEQILVQFSGYTANAEAYVNIQTKLIKEPVAMHRRSIYYTGEN